MSRYTHKMAIVSTIDSVTSLHPLPLYFCGTQNDVTCRPIRLFDEFFVLK